MRSLSGAGAALLGGRLVVATLVEMQLDTPLYMTDAGIDLQYDGNTWLGGRQVAVEKVGEQGGEVQALKFSISGVPSENIALALATPIQGKPVRAYAALMDPDSQAVVDVIPLWRGTLDQMPIRHGAEFSTISVTAEHIAIGMARPKGLRYTDADQRRLYPGDRALEFIVAQATHQDVWPSAAYFRK